ncbi:MAG: DUF4159 domain-containing protein [Hyphomicrobiales bacterium]|nr:MAG: DUF4159 domain-containing protein [Hyphomicrobiales bacterium]
MTLGPIAFLSPWLLVGLAALPVIYWLLRTVPPSPTRLSFPPTRILMGVLNREKTPAQTPWWLMLIRLLAAALVILALADPVLNPNREKALAGSGPVAIVVDNGWASAAHWQQRTFLVGRLITEAESQRRAVVIVPTATVSKANTLRVEAPSAARSTAAALQPQPFAPDRAAVAQALGSVLGSEGKSAVVWLTDGIDHDGAARTFIVNLAKIAGGGLTVVEETAGQEAVGVTASVGSGGKLEAQVLRAGGPARAGILHAVSARGQRLGEATFALGAGETKVQGTFELPLELRNQVTRVEIAGERSAGAVNLLDARSQWHRIGLISGASREQAQPLLAPLYYIERALAPFSEIAKSEDSNLETTVEALIKRNISGLMLADVGTLPHDIKERLSQWVRKGGVLVRFAGPRLEKGGDDLLPVPLRVGGRALGGALSWATPQPLAPFGDDSLFAGLAIPQDVQVNRQVLADPASLGPETRVWARLKDGTPLVTAKRYGDGHLVFFHVTANSDWSNLPLSGLFVEMLRRTASLGKQGGGNQASLSTDGSETAPSTDVLAPLQVLDGFGALRNPPPTTQAISGARIADAQPSAENPPGYYGPAGTPRALNLITAKTIIKPLPPLPFGVERRVYEGDNAQPMKPTLLTAALALLFADMLAVLALQMTGSIFNGRRLGRSATTALLVAVGIGTLALVAGSETARAQQPAPSAPPAAARTATPADLARAIQATGKVSFGYVISGDAATDEASRVGLQGLNKFLVARTAVEPGEPFPVNIQSDEIAFFPILYWPVLPNSRTLPEPTLAKIDAYMKQGGMIIFDTKDFGQGVPTGFNLQAQGGTPLQRLLGNLDIPRLEPVPEHHVLTKSFYLLRSFPGRWDGGQLWVEAEAPRDSDQGRQARRVDGVSSILITSNDFASAWALDDRNQPIYPVVPGGERQREMAFRVGVNIVMYALTGNYKADQVHVPALLERLGQ